MHGTREAMVTSFSINEAPEVPNIIQYRVFHSLNVRTIVTLSK